MSDELKSCPWCGCDPKELSLAEGSTYRWMRVECPECSAGPGEIRMMPLNTDDRLARAKADAIAAWNTRTGDRK